MKKLKTLCAVVGAAAMLYGGSAFAAEQKYEVPEYNLEDAVTGKKEIPLETGSKFVWEAYGVDRNKDGKIDLIEQHFFYYRHDKEENPVKHMKFLYIDDHFDGYLNRELIDWDGDGIYDEKEEYSSDFKIPIDKLPYGDL